jgi:50S ribosomal protein L16 3-hydroxylase
MNPLLGGMDPRSFLEEYWQKKPLLIRQAFPGFQPELDADDIAGLACDELAESRIVSGSYPRHDWQLRYGPFDERDFRDLPEQDWTLLVQDVEKHYPPLRRLLDRFDFIPRWRIDDLMVSVAAPGGSVGPHVDQYDVFLLQAEGRRRWQIASDFTPALLENCELNVLETFEHEQEWLLEAGDMLYLPPGIAHHGTALESCMTWSIGMRAPSAADLHQAYGEWLATERGEGRRYSDPDLAIQDDPGFMEDAALDRFAELASPMAMGSDDFRLFLGAFLSRYRLAHEPAGPENLLDAPSLKSRLATGSCLRQNPWTRLIWLEQAPGAVLFAAGMRYSCSRETASLFCDDRRLARNSCALNADQLDLATQLLNGGHLYLDSES